MINWYTKTIFKYFERFVLNLFTKHVLNHCVTYEGWRHSSILRMLWIWWIKTELNPINNSEKYILYWSIILFILYSPFIPFQKFHPEFDIPPFLWKSLSQLGNRGRETEKNIFCVEHVGFVIVFVGQEIFKISIICQNGIILHLICKIM